MNKLEELKAKKFELANEICKIEDEAKFKELQKNEGKFYKYKNSYSTGDKWWLYTKVVSVIPPSETTRPSVKHIQFQLCGDDKTPDIKLFQGFHGSSLDIEITEAEYEKAKCIFLNRVNEILGATK